MGSTPAFLTDTKRGQKKSCLIEGSLKVMEPCGHLFMLWLVICVRLTYSHRYQHLVHSFLLAVKEDCSPQTD